MSLHLPVHLEAGTAGRGGAGRDTVPAIRTADRAGCNHSMQCRWCLQIARRGSTRQGKVRANRDIAFSESESVSVRLAAGLLDIPSYTSCPASHRPQLPQHNKTVTTERSCPRTSLGRGGGSGGPRCKRPQHDEQTAPVSSISPGKHGSRQAAVERRGAGGLPAGPCRVCGATMETTKGAASCQAQLPTGADGQ